MDTKKKAVPAGTLLLLSRGEYSDYSIVALCRVLKPIDQTVWAVMGAACTGHCERNPERFDDSRALPWLIEKGYVEEVEYRELHLGDYGRCSLWERA